MDHDFNLQFADFVLRCVTGILFIFQGYDRAFKMRANEIVNVFQTNLTRKILPVGLLRFIVMLSAYIEVIAGLMLFIGFYREIALYVLALQMIFVTIAFSMVRPMWDMQYFFPRFVFVIALLIFPSGWDRFSLDHLLK